MNYSYPNSQFTKIPNWYFDLVPSLPESSNKIFLVIARQTLGYQRQWHMISHADFQSLTGLSKNSVRSGITFLINFKPCPIQVKQEGQYHYYSINELYQSATGANFDPVIHRLQNATGANFDPDTRCTGSKFATDTRRPLNNGDYERPPKERINIKK